MGDADRIRIVEVRDAAGFARIPPCADPGFDHRSCDYWEDADRGSKAARLSWLDPVAGTAASPAGAAGSRSDRAGERGPSNPFQPSGGGPAFNPFARESRPSTANPFGDVADDEPAENPFAPKREARPAVAPDAPRKLQLLGRGLAVVGTYAKVLELDGEPAIYVQFGPLSAYPRAQRVRELYPRLPAAPLPAVITCIAATPAGRGSGHARRLVAAVCDDLAGRGFAAVEAYPEPGARPDATSAASTRFWLACGFAIAIEDERFPVVRREL